MNIESIAREILEQTSFCKSCPEGGRKSYCFSDLEEQDDSWGDHCYEFERENFKLRNWVSCDGGDDIIILYKKELVYRHDYYDGEDEGEIIYERGIWEVRLRELYERIVSEQLSLALT